MTFEERQNRERYAALNPVVLDGIADDKLVRAIIDHIEDVFLKGLVRGSAEEYACVEALPEKLRPFITLHMLDEVVKTGCLLEWFWSSSGRIAPLAVEDLRRIGASGHAELFARALSLLADEQAAFESASIWGWTPDRAFSWQAGASKLLPLDEEYCAIIPHLQTLLATHARRELVTIQSS